MVIRLDENYNAMTSTALLGYVGETNARPVSVEGMEIDGADRYVMTIDYGDGVQYEVDITGGTWTPTADILRSAQTISCQICAKKLSGQEYILVKKSRIFRLRIGAAIGDNAVPSPDVAADALDRIDAIGKQTHADMQTAVTAAETATTAANNAAKSDTSAEKSADTAEQAASRAETAKASAETAAQTAQSIADSLPEDYVTAVEKIAENTVEIANVKLTDKELQRRVNALYSIGQGITHQFETDSETAYQKTVPTGAKLMSVKSIGGHSEVIDGEIVSAGTESVVEQGKNLLNADDYYAAYKQSDGSYLNNSSDFAGINIPIGNYIGKTLIATLKATVSSQPTSFFWLARINGTRIESSYAKGERVPANTTGIARLTFTPKTQKDTLSMTYGQGTGDVIVRDIQIELGDTPTTYAPFHRNVYQIPEVIKALPGYGWSAGTARNYVDYENKKYYQCVNSVDLGTLEWLYRPEQQRFYAIADSITGKFSESFGIVPNIVVAKYDIVCFNDITTKTDNMKASAVKTANDYITIRNTAYTDATAFKQAMQGVILYYELANPIVTDISSLVHDDFLRNLEVEAGGSITFKGGNDDYRIPVPSEEEYIVKLSEVGGTT